MSERSGNVAGASGEAVPPGIDISRPHPARMYDYYLGGKDNFAIDRETAEMALQNWPSGPVAARANRGFLARAVSYLAGQAGIRQFLDIGTGLPSADNTHEVAQRTAPDSRIVYADNDPLVLAHARALLTSAPAGRTAYIQADLREPGKILASPQVRGTLDFSRPIALMLVAILHFFTDEEEPGSIVRTLLAEMPPGSYLVASHLTPEHNPESIHGMEDTYRSRGVTVRSRTAEEFGRTFFSGLELVPPGVVLTSEWRREDAGPRPRPEEVNTYGAVGRKQSLPVEAGLRDTPPGGATRTAALAEAAADPASAPSRPLSRWLRTSVPRCARTTRAGCLGRGSGDRRSTHSFGMMMRRYPRTAVTGVSCQTGESAGRSRRAFGPGEEGPGSTGQGGR